MIRITITHVRDHPDGSTTETIDDEYLGTIDGLAARLIAVRAAIAVDSMDRLDDALKGPDKSARGGPTRSGDAPSGPTVIAPPNHAPVIVSTAERVAPWTGRLLYGHAKPKPGMFDWLMSWGRDQGYPRRMLEWTTPQCDYAVGAWEAHQKRSVA